MNNPKKRILILSPFFYPEPISTGKFNTDLAVKLSEIGHKVTVLCSHPVYPKWLVKKTKDQIKGIKIERGGGFIKYPQSTIFRRLILEVWYSFFVLSKVNMIKKFDLIIPIFPPSLFFFFLTCFSRIKKVGIVHDLQEIYSSNKTGIINCIIGFFIKTIESRAFKNCDNLIFLSEEMKENALKSYKLTHQNLQVQYPFINISLKSNTNDLCDILPDSKEHIVYSGALGEKQNPAQLYEFFNYASKKMTSTEFHFFSQGEAFNNLRILNKNANIKFHDLVPKENIEELYKRSTVQIIPQLPNTSKGSLPSKLPNLLISGCKILLICDKGSEIERLFIDNNFYKPISSWENSVMFESLRTLLKAKNNFTEDQINTINNLFSLDSLIKKIVK